ncbi:MAG: T9SS type A sorting domain-containing protein [Saprospiraceae bacterium]|nr:T9SS type A sorting domain-containing protein [Candidatus Opimibacter skivensis]
MKKTYVMALILWMCSMILPGRIQAQGGGCAFITFTAEHFEPCKYRLQSDNSNECYSGLRILLSEGSYVSWEANVLEGWTATLISPTEIQLTHASGILPIGINMPVDFSIPPGISPLLSVLWDYTCPTEEGCVVDLPLEGCPIIADGCIEGFVYMECDELPFINQEVLSDWTIELLDDTGNVLVSEVTGLDGAYSFCDLPAGTYIVQVRGQPGWTANVPPTGQSTIQLNESEIAEQNFGMCMECACGVFSDLLVRSAGSPSQPTTCQGSPVAFGCPSEGVGFNITGFFDCLGGNCELNTQITWALSGQNIAQTGTILASPAFNLNLSSTWFTEPGLYTVALEGQCGNNTCQCTIQLEVDCDLSCEETCTESLSWITRKASQDGKDLGKKGGKVYMAGSFDVGEFHNIVSWDGVTFSPLGLGTNGPIEVLVVHGDNIYVGGRFTMAGDIEANNIAYWDGAWHAVGDGVGGSDSSIVSSLLSTAEGVVVGGEFNNVGNNIAFWDGTNWIQNYFGDGMNGPVNALTLYNGNIVAGGYFASPANNIATWSNGSWSGLAQGINDFGIKENGIKSMLQINADQLVVGGLFKEAVNENDVTVSGTQHIALWNGIEWSSLSTGVNTGEEGIYDIVMCNDNLYVAGDFSEIGGQMISGIAQWDALEGSWVSTSRGPTAVLALACVSINSETCDLIAAGDGFLDQQVCLTAVNEIEKQNLKISPSPNNGEFMIELSEAAKQGLSIQIMSLTGHVLFERKVEIGTSLQHIHATDLPQGMYFLQVVSNGSLKSINKFVKL